MTPPPFVSWIKKGSEWHLMVHEETFSRCVATVWPNGTWHTWDHNGTGGENDCEQSVQRAKIEAAASAIEQGFI